MNKIKERRSFWKYLTGGALLGLVAQALAPAKAHTAERLRLRDLAAELDLLRSKLEKSNLVGEVKCFAGNYEPPGWLFL